MLKKSLITSLSLGMLAFMIVVGCGSTTGSSNGAEKVSATDVKAVTDANAMPADGKIVVGTDNTYPPMEYMDTNDPNRMIGFDVDLGNALGKVLNKQVVWKPTQWDGILPGLLANKYDVIISSMNDTADREKQIDFIDYVNFGQVILVKSSNNDPIQTINDLKGKKAGVQINTTSDDALKQVGGITIKEYNTFPDAFADLSAGRLDAVVVDEPVGRYYLNVQPDKYKVAGQPFESEPMGIGIRKDETQLSADLKQALDKLKSDGTYDKIYSYWFGAK